MKNYLAEDLFLKKQPEMGFIDQLLRPVHEKKPPRWNERPPRENELLISSVSLRNEFPDPEGLLETAFEDLRLFMSISDISENERGTSLRIAFAETDCREAYKITVGKAGIVVESGDTEGIRRALIYIEDEMLRREGAFLPVGVIERRPFIRSRISRCFFAPPSHASNEGMVNELASDIDYYPEAYLNRLAHDGINGLWIGASFHDILKSDVIPECGADSERRLKKLGEIVKKCRRYGIGIYLFSIEPASGYSNPHLEKHPEFLGSKGRYGDTHLFCPSTEGCQKYIKDAITRLFTAIPDLAGFMDITTGECLSGCGSNYIFACPRCKEKFGSHAATLAATEKMIADAMKEVAPHAEFISWTYNQRVWDRETLRQTCELRDPSIIHMQNFEDYAKPTQLGRKRIAMDYWLSFTGPGEIMAESLAINRRRGVRTYAKIQACSSHEISTVPYVPVPGILYDKYKFMRENDISGVVQCWYFGNYPCMMNKAACELSFEPFFDKKNDFLEHMAGIYWGSNARTVASAWEKFEEGYRNFPVSVSFEWFGPMQDSPAVPLHLIPADHPMPSTWLICDPVGGDRIGECLTDGHTPSEAIELASGMCRGFYEGNAILSTLDAEGDYPRFEQKSVAKALSVLFESGLNILRFYELRHRLGLCKGDPREILDSLEEIAREERKNSERMIELCAADSRLGYHSEAHGYKFFDEKLKWRIGELDKCLETEFPTIRKRIEDGLAPLSFYLGEGNNTVTVRISDTAAPTDFLGSEKPHTSVTAVEKDGRIILTFRMKDGEEDTLYVRPEYHLFHPSAPFTLSGGILDMPNTGYYSFIDEFADARRAAFKCLCQKDDSGAVVYTVSFHRSAVGMEANEPFRLAVTRRGRHNEQLTPDGRVYTRLIQAKFSPDAYAMFIK